MNGPGLMDEMFESWKQYQQVAHTAQRVADSYLAARRKLWSVWLSSLADLVPVVAENWHASLSATAQALQGTVPGRTATLEESILEGTIVPESGKESRASRKTVNQKESSERAVA